MIHCDYRSNINLTENKQVMFYRAQFVNCVSDIHHQISAVFWLAVRAFNWDFVLFSGHIFMREGNIHQRLVSVELPFTYRKGQKNIIPQSQLWDFGLLHIEIFKLGLGCHKVSFLREWERMRRVCKGYYSWSTTFFLLKIMNIDIDSKVFKIYLSRQYTSYLDDNT